MAYGYTNSVPQTYDEMLFENPTFTIGKTKGNRLNNFSTENELNFYNYNYVVVADSGNILNLKGLSGSPIFLKHSNSKFKSGGLIFAGVKNEIFIVRPKFIHDELLRLIKKSSEQSQ